MLPHVVHQLRLLSGGKLQGIISEFVRREMKTERHVSGETGSVKTTGEEFLLKEIMYPRRNSHGNCSYDLVEEMSYIFVHVIKAVNLSSTCSPFVEVKIGDFQAITKPVQDVNLEWDQIFAFLKDQVNALSLLVLVRKKVATPAVGGESDFLGQLTFDLEKIPFCNRQNKLASEWYKLVDRSGKEIAEKGELLLDIWIGTQVDESFHKAWHSDGTSVIASEYMLPRFWYLRVNVIEAQDIVVQNDENRPPEVQVVAVLGNQTLSTKISYDGMNPLWNEDLLFVIAEPFRDELVLTVEEVGGLGKNRVLGRCLILLEHVDTRLDHKPQLTRWYNLSRVSKRDENGRAEPRFYSKIHVRVSKEGGYHVFSEPFSYCSDFRPTAKQLWRASIGVLELGILRAYGLLPMKTKDGIERTDAYCVAKYGMKWARTRTITNNLNPKWNDQCSWEVFDQFSVITIGVFDDNHFDHGYGGENDSRIGKVRIRVSRLKSGQIYKQKYPLLVPTSSGVKKMGEIEIGVRFTCTSWINTVTRYSQPLLPKMHYMNPLSVMQINSLRDVVTEIISSTFDKAEPPLRREVVDDLLDVDSDKWSFRRSKINYLRVLNILRWFDKVCKWEKPFYTILILTILTTIWLDPKLIPSTVLLSLVLICIWNYNSNRSWDPPDHMDSDLSLDLDELNEEFDTFPTSETSDIVKMRYDRLRSIGSRIQSEVEEWACFLETFQSLVTWADPRATKLFLLFCIFAVVVFYYLQIRALVIVGFYLLRPPWLRFFNAPLAPLNFLSRLPSKVDQML